MFVFEDADSTAGLSDSHSVLQLPDLRRQVTAALLFLVDSQDQSAIFFKECVS